MSSAQFVLIELDVATAGPIAGLLRAPIGPFPSREAAFDWARGYLAKHGGSGSYMAAPLTNPEADR